MTDGGQVYDRTVDIHLARVYRTIGSFYKFFEATFSDGDDSPVDKGAGMVAHIGKLPDMLPSHVYRVVFKSDDDHQAFVSKFNGKCQLSLDDVPTDAYVSDRTVSTSDVRVSYFPPDWSLDVLKGRMKQFGNILSADREFYNDSSMAKWKKVASTLVVHVKMVIEQPIPSYITIGDVRVFVQYRGQAPTCRMCDSTQHKVFECPNRKPIGGSPGTRVPGNKPVAPKPVASKTVAPANHRTVDLEPTPLEVRSAKGPEVDAEGFQMVPLRKNKGTGIPQTGEKRVADAGTVPHLEDLLTEAEQLGVLVTVPAEAEAFYQTPEGEDPKRSKKKQNSKKKKDLRSKEARDVLKVFERTYAAATQAEAADFPQAQQWVAQVERALAGRPKIQSSKPDGIIIPDSITGTVSPTYAVEYITPQLHSTSDEPSDNMATIEPLITFEGDKSLQSSGQSSGIPAGQPPRELSEDEETDSLESEMDLTS